MAKENENPQQPKEKKLFNKAPVAMAITEKYRKVYEPESPKIAPIDFAKAFKLFSENIEEKGKETFFSLLSKEKIPPVSVSNWSDEVLKALSPYFDVSEVKDNIDGRVNAMLQRYKKWLAKEFTDIDAKRLKSLTVGRVRVSELYNMLATMKPNKDLPNYYNFGIKNPTKQNLKALDSNALTTIEKWLEAS